jgi:hypothetical protein
MTEPPVGPALPGEECRVLPHESWSDLEKWVWQQVGSGRVADINAHLGKIADPKKSEDWGPERCLSPAFLETIHLYDPWRGAIPRAAVRIFGALFAEMIDLRWSELPVALWIDRSRFLAPVLLSSVRASRDLSFRGSVFLDELLLDSAKIDGSLFLRDTEFSTIIARGATINGQLTFVGSKMVNAPLDLQMVRIGESLLMDCGKFYSIPLSESRINSHMHISKVDCRGF